MNSHTPLNTDTVFGVEQIIKMIPHRYPFLMLDRVTQVVPKISAVGLKNVTINEPYFEGHFPNKPIVPGVLLIESMAQTAAIVVVSGYKDTSDKKIVYFMSIESARFRKPVIPGDTLTINVATKQSRGNVWKFNGKVFVEEILVAESSFTAMVADK